jgi:hypothetical protein
MFVRTAYVLVAVVFVIAGLSCASSDSPVNPAPGPGNQAATATIDPTGGEISAASNRVVVTLRFPEGAVRFPTEITLRPADAVSNALVGMLLEPAGMVFLADVDVRVELAGEVDLTDQILFFGDPNDPVLLPTSIDTGTQTLTAPIRSFGIPNNGGIPESFAAARQAHPGNNLGVMQQNCQQVLNQAQTSFDNYVAQGDFENALRSALSSAALLQQSACPTAVQQWLDTVADVACTHFEDAVNAANQATITSYGDFEKHAKPMVNWAGIAAQLSPTCSANFDYLTALDGLVARFVVWYQQRLATVSGPNLQVYSDLKQELVQLNILITDALALGLNDGARQIENDAIFPTLERLRDAAYGLGQVDGWHYALTKLTTAGFFAGRDIIGVPDPRLCDDEVSPPQCFTPPQQFGYLSPGPFTNEDVYDDIQFCATDIAFRTLAASDTLYSSESTGGEGSPGQRTDEITIQCPTRGTIEIDGKIGALTRFTTDEDADTEIVVNLAGTEVLALRRPPGGDEYLQGTPAAIDIMRAAEDAGITPKGGAQHELKIIRKRPNGSDLLWGEQEFTLLTATLEWVNPTLEVEVDVPATIDPGATANVDVRVKVIDQLNQAGFFEGIDIVLSAAGGTLQQLSGQTDEEGYFRTQITADSGPQPVMGLDGETVQGIQIDATATSFEGVTATGSAVSSTVPAVEFLTGYMVVSGAAGTSQSDDPGSVFVRQDDVIEFSDGVGYGVQWTCDEAPEYQMESAFSSDLTCSILLDATNDYVSQVEVQSVMEATGRLSSNGAGCSGNGSLSSAGLFRIELDMQATGGPATITLQLGPSLSGIVAIASVQVSQWDEGDFGGRQSRVDYSIEEDGRTIGELPISVTIPADKIFRIFVSGQARGGLTVNDDSGSYSSNAEITFRAVVESLGGLEP